MHSTETVDSIPHCAGAWVSRGAVVLGASAGVGRALAEALARQGWDIVVAARSGRDLDAICLDVAIRHGTRAHPIVADLAAPDIGADGFYAECVCRLDRIDALLVSAGFVSPEDSGVVDGEALETTIRVNYLNAVRLIARFARAFEEKGAGTIVACTSIAAAVPRRRHGVYASAKAGLEVYLRALRHHFAGTGVLVQAYALGYVDSAMTFGQKLRLPPVSPHRVAAHILGHLDRDVGVRYFPRYWWLLTRILRCLPWFIYRRLSF